MIVPVDLVAEYAYESWRTGVRSRAPYPLPWPDLPEAARGVWRHTAFGLLARLREDGYVVTDVRIPHADDRKLTPRPRERSRAEIYE